jgi:hypothetical protein
MYLARENDEISRCRAATGEGFGVATSRDGQHWTDKGYVWHGPSWVQHRWWEGTGAVWRAADFNKTGRYVINYSQCPSKGAVGFGGQNITFAESYDLIHWTQTADNGFVQSYFDIDTEHYKDPGRWDCIFSIPLPNATGGDGVRDGYPRYGCERSALQLLRPPLSLASALRLSPSPSLCLPLCLSLRALP